jgi:hypothetical protein
VTLRAEKKAEQAKSGTDLEDAHTRPDETVDKPQANRYFVGIDRKLSAYGVDVFATSRSDSLHETIAQEVLQESVEIRPSRAWRETRHGRRRDRHGRVPLVGPLRRCHRLAPTRLDGRLSRNCRLYATFPS